MKIKNKGKVYPSPPPPPSSSSSVNGDEFLSVLKLLPAAILVLASVLSPDDREVLAYLITRSLKTTTTTTTAAVSSAGNSTAAASSTVAHDSKKKNSSKKKMKKSGEKKGEIHNKPPEFECDCFDCYTSYWLRWDSSPNRELIHQVIEAFEDHLITGEASASSSSSASSQKPKRNNGRTKKKEKSGRRTGDKSKPAEPLTRPEEPLADFLVPGEAIVDDVSVEDSRKSSPGGETGDGYTADVAERGKEEVEVARETLMPEDSSVVVRTTAATERKGLARKVLPDVLGLLNSRLWSLWNPNA